jgi:pilus assembly protein Flp/PilA
MKAFAKCKDFIRDERAASSVEYALLVAGMSLAALTAIHDLGTALKAKLTIPGMPYAK